MALLDRFRPQWRHSDPSVRRGAVKHLDDITLLDRRAAEDPDSTVRDAARDRARELRVRIAASTSPLAECEAAVSRLEDETDLAAIARSAHHPEVKRAALAGVSSDRLLREIVKQAADADTRRSALHRIQDPAALRSVALGEGSAELALAALERIADLDVLRAIAVDRSASKAVRKRAQAMLPAADDAPTVDVKKAHARQLQLGVAMRGLGAMIDSVAAAAQARELDREWQSLARVVPPKPDVAARFEATSRSILAVAERAIRDREEADRRQAALDAALAARLALCEQVETAAEADAARIVEDARREWSRLPPIADENHAKLDARFRSACQRAQLAHERRATEEAQRRELESIVTAAETLSASDDRNLADRWRALEQRWAASPLTKGDHDVATLKQRWARATDRVREQQQAIEQRRTEDDRSNLRRLEALLGRLNDLFTVESLRLGPARAALREVDATLERLGPLPATERPGEWKRRLSDAKANLRRRVVEQEEAEGWRRWANVDVQEALIGRAEALLASDDLPEITRQLKPLQDEWAQCAAAPPEKAQALWNRFSTVRDQLRKRSDAWLQANLEKKRGLCARVADVGDSTAWNETAELIRGAQAEWKEIGPVPHRHAQPLWQQFREPCDRFFARRKAQFERLDREREGNAARKVALCEKAEALQDSTDWDATTEVFKNLQAEWKRSGPPPREQADALWERFRSACDRFFDRRGRREELELEDALGKAGAIAAQLATLARSLDDEDAPASEQVKEQLDDGWGTWLRLDLATVDAAAEVQTEIHAACLAIAANRPDGVRGSRLDPQVTKPRRAKLCERLEKLADAPSGPPVERSLQEQALALRERLAANTIAGSDAKDAGDQERARERERIAAAWALLGPPLDEEARALEERFERARSRLV